MVRNWGQNSADWLENKREIGYGHNKVMFRLPGQSRPDRFIVRYLSSFATYLHALGQARAVDRDLGIVPRAGRKPALAF